MLIVDANVAVALAVPLPYSDYAQRRFLAWREAEIEIVAPALWTYEVTSALHRMMVLGRLGTEEVDRAMKYLFKLGIRLEPPTEGSAFSALHWARKLGLSAAYDASYLAVAEKNGAELWTADTKLVEKARKARLSWVRHISEQ